MPVRPIDTAPGGNLIHQAIVQTAGCFQFGTLLPHTVEKFFSGLTYESDARQIHNGFSLLMLRDVVPTVL
jgi:hypothetical protein